MSFKGEAMEYRITKDCGLGWNFNLETKPPHAWSVAKAQVRIAANIKAGDILLHFIDGPRAWAGYSVVLDEMQDNTSESETDREAHPKVIPTECGVWLTMDQCFNTVAIPGLSSLQYHRKRTFTVFNLTDAKLIQAAIDAAQTQTSIADEQFKLKWNVAPDGFYWHIARDTAGGQCWLCKETAATWLEKHFGTFVLTDEERNRIHRSFVDIAHIQARSDLGPIAPDNVRALCPTCHRIVDRLSPERKTELLAERRVGEA